MKNDKQIWEGKKLFKPFVVSFAPKAAKGMSQISSERINLGYKCGFL